MIVEPVPTNPRSPVRRALRVAGLAVPVVLLVAVVAAGALGPRPEGVAPDASASPHAAAIDAPAQPTPTATQAPPSPAPAIRLRQPADFPAAFAGFPVRSVADTLAAHAAGRAKGIVAVAGYLDLGALPWTCLDAYLDPPGPTCIGRTLMRDWFESWGQLGPGPAGIGADLLPRFRPGTRGPIPDFGRDGPRSQPLPVVLLGSFDRAGDTAFTVERVVWVAGEDWNVTLTVDPALGVDPNIPEIQASIRDATGHVGADALVTTTAVVRPGALATIDADAAAALPPIPVERRQRPVTYVRWLVAAAGRVAADPDRTATIAWIVLDSITGRLLASGAWPGSTAAG